MRGDGATSTRCPRHARARGDDGEVDEDQELTTAGTHRLIDCGDGRRLDAFGTFVADRPAPAASEPPRAPDLWVRATRFDAASGWRTADGAALADGPTTVTIAGLTLEVRPAAGGQVGLFPEHAANAESLVGAIRSRHAPDDPGATAPEILNLFAYTGLLTLVAARAGARVVHLDGSRPAVAWARRNAERSGLTGRPIRWLVDDALAFVRREGRRGRRYAGLILDPPSYGHGRRGDRGAWRFDDGIVELLDACAGIAEPDAFWLLSTHTPGWEPERLAAVLATATDAGRAEVDAAELRLEAESGAALRLGATARFDPRPVQRR